MEPVPDKRMPFKGVLNTEFNYIFSCLFDFPASDLCYRVRGNNVLVDCSVFRVIENNGNPQFAGEMGEIAEIKHLVKSSAVRVFIPVEYVSVDALGEVIFNHVALLVIHGNRLYYFDCNNNTESLYWNNIYHYMLLKCVFPKVKEAWDLTFRIRDVQVAVFKRCYIENSCAVHVAYAMNLMMKYEYDARLLNTCTFHQEMHWFMIEITRLANEVKKEFGKELDVLQKMPRSYARLIKWKNWEESDKARDLEAFKDNQVK